MAKRTRSRRAKRKRAHEDPLSQASASAAAKGGRKPTPIAAKQIAKLAAGLNQEQIADFYGMTDRGLRKRFAADQELRIAYQAGRSKAVSRVATNLLAQATKTKNPNITAMIFYLKTQAGWKETSAVEVAGPDGGPIAVSSTNVRERVAHRISGIAGRMIPGAAVPAAVANRNGNGNGNGKGRHG